MSTPRPLWQAAGALALAHVVLIPCGILLQNGPRFSEGVEGIQARYVDGDLTRTVAGGLLEAFGFLLLVAALVFVARHIGTRDERGRWAAQTGLACGLGYVAVTFAVGFPAGAVAMYGAQHGLDLDTAFAFNNLRVFSYFLSLMLLGGNVLGIAVAALSDRTHRGWLGGFGLVTGVSLLVAPALARWDLQDLPTLVWMVWFVGLAVLLLRHRPGSEPVGMPASVTEPARVGQA